MFDIQSLIRYLMEGLAVALAAYFIPQIKVEPQEIALIALTAAAVFAVLDQFSPGVAAGTRQGAGFGIGFGQFSGMTGGGGHEPYEGFIDVSSIGDLGEKLEEITRENQEKLAGLSAGDVEKLDAINGDTLRTIVSTFPEEAIHNLTDLPNDVLGDLDQLDAEQIERLQLVAQSADWDSFGGHVSDISGLVNYLNTNIMSESDLSQDEGLRDRITNVLKNNPDHASDICSNALGIGEEAQNQIPTTHEIHTINGEMDPTIEGFEGWSKIF